MQLSLGQRQNFGYSPTYRRAEIARQLAPLNATVLFGRHSPEASEAIRSIGQAFNFDISISGCAGVRANWPD